MRLSFKLVNKYWLCVNPFMRLLHTAALALALLVLGLAGDELDVVGCLRSRVRYSHALTRILSAAAFLNANGLGGR